MKKSVILILKVILLTIIMFISMAVSSLLVGVQSSSDSSSSSALLALIYCFLNTLILALFITKSKLRGLKLAVTSFIVFWGIQYFMTQIETLYFNSAIKMPITQVAEVVASGAIYSGIFSLIAVLILGKFKKEPNFVYDADKVKISIIELLPNMAVLSLSYVVIYFAFGYFVAWQFAALRYYYTGSTQILNVFVHISNQFRDDPMLFLFQVFRGFLWSLLAITIIRSLDIKSRVTYAITGLLFSVLITTPLLFPNDYMPAPVRFGHSFELSTSMLVFGVLSVIIFKNKFYECNTNSLNESTVVK